MKVNNFLSSVVLSTTFLIIACNKTDDTGVTPTTTAAVSALSCSSATFSATATASAAYTGTATIPYTGGNGAAYSTGTAIASTGVTGLTATLAAGTLASGAGSATFAITGTPSAAGTASFAISLGGQSCTLALTVNAASTSTGGTAWSVDTDIAKIVAAAEAFKATLSSSQVSSAQYSYTVAQAKLWSNLPQSLYKGRVGLASSTFSAAQWTAFYNLLKAATGTGANEGNEEYAGIVDADDYLRANGGDSGYGSGNYYIGFLGTPSTTGLWCLQIGGHHGTIIYTYNGGKMTGGTPSFRSTEPYPTWVSTNTSKTVQPLVQETAAFANFLKSLSASELTTAKRAAAQNDIIVGPQKDGSFPTTKSGVKAGNLTTTQKDLLLAAIKTYVDDLDDKAAAAVLAKYKSELDETYVSYYGGTTMAAKGDYILIDGPSVWIEWSMQGGIIIRNGVHPHSVWRDRKSDYGGN
ncbi:DUF3500 domain-containing protein [Runella salmonicolor]|uniref:DUF3500 domain-containing protein n=1 Tax=Runella salmonicolor TaxID=2950278 RepID=A0ABT1FSL3_9BACT|nr:DUF3500 domain-containing protein [Runella salmonicolor]MCP1383758.1 DUF3500 domain-containing protein [Runella salmonicolor]